jgi:hypothetical protein
MPRFTLVLAAALIAVFVAACGGGPTLPPEVLPSFAPTSIIGPTSAPPSGATPGQTQASPFEGQPYALDLPGGWVAFDLSDPAGVAALDEFVAANPDMGAAIEAFKALPNVTMAVNPVLGNVVVALPVPSGGQSLEVLAAAFTTQFGAVPGIVGVPVAEDVSLRVGPAFRWHITIEANDPAGGTFQVGESIYLAGGETTAILVEFVEVGGSGVAQEQQIIQSLRFTP